MSVQVKRSLKRILSNIVCLILLSAGSLFTIFFFGNVELSQDFEVGTRYVTLFAVILMALIVLLEIAAQFLNKDASINTLYISLFCLGYVLTSHDAINMIAFFHTVKYPIVFEISHSVIYFGAMFFILRFYAKNYGVDTSFFSRIGLALIGLIATADIVLIIFHTIYY